MCCCCTKRTGHLVVVWFSLISNVSTTVLGVALLSFPSVYPLPASIAFVVLGIVGVCLCVLDIYGISKNKISYMTPFLVWMILSTISAGIGAVIVICQMIILASSDSDHVKGQGSLYIMYGVMIAAVVLSGILNGYFSYVISSHKKEVKAQQGYDDMKTEVNMVAR